MDAAQTPNAAPLRRSAAMLDGTLSRRLADNGRTGRARARLETELGGDLARLLVHALVDRRTRAGSPTAA
jgi:hypothetical protein